MLHLQYKKRKLVANIAVILQLLVFIYSLFYKILSAIIHTFIFIDYLKFFLGIVNVYHAVYYYV